MAGDWIKLECTTPDKPEIVRMAATLRIDQDAVVGKLLRVWVWADQNSVAGESVTITASFIDRMTNKKGFAAAMREAGWLVGDDGAMTFPNFKRHNGTTAKARSVTNRRVTTHRKCNADTVTKTEQKPLPEGEKREIKQEPPVERAGAPKSKAEVIAEAERFMPTSSVRDKPDAGFIDWWWDEQEKRGWVDPQSGLPWHDWRAAFTGAWRGCSHRTTERKSKTYGPNSQPPPGRNVGHNANVSYANRPQRPAPGPNGET